jgi:hypothetical protein
MFHPTNPYILSVSGSRHFEEPALERSSSSDESLDVEDVEIMVSGAWRLARGSLVKLGPRQPTTLDNSLKLWAYSGA